MTTLSDIRNIVCQEQNLSKGLKALKELTAEKHLDRFQMRIEAIQEDYQRMCQFMLTGMPDDHRFQLYTQLLQQLYDLLGDVDLHLRITNKGSAFAQAFSHAAHLNTSNELVRQNMESYVQDVAMASLETSPEERSEQLSEIHARHHKFLSMLFSYLVASPSWNLSTARFYMSLLTSPTIDLADACTLVGALMLSCRRWFDVNKFLTIVHVYCQATDNQLRQRALVAWCFSLAEQPMSLYGGCKAELTRLLEEEEVRNDVLELQMQVFLCMRTEEDNQLIQRDIMPTLLKNQNLQITRFGIVEKDDDNLQDILDPGAAERNMEELEKTIRKMESMQKAGTDVFFGGFRLMKRFSFFYTLSNWFVPFSLDHPALQPVIKKVGSTQIITNVIDANSFCESDKYSLTLAMAHVIDRLPANLKEMMSNGAIAHDRPADPTRHSAAYIRRMYLQDLFRFFQLYTQKSEFPSPFSYNSSTPNFNFFFVFPLFAGTGMRQQALPLLRFLLKNRLFAFMQPVIDCYPGTTNEYLVMQAVSAMETQQENKALNLFEQVLQTDHNNERVLRYHAMLCFRCEHYQQAEHSYARLVELAPHKLSYRLNLAICKVYNMQTNEGVNELYQLEYEHHENLAIVRALAWGLLMARRYEPANKIYQRLLNEPAHDDHTDHTDLLHAGYCRWFMGRVEEAVQLLKQYTSLENTSIETEMQRDQLLFKANKINEVDQKIMADMI